MPDTSKGQPGLTQFLGPAVIIRAAVVALLLGSVLTLLNQWHAVFGNETIARLPLALVFATPFVVVVLSQLLALRRAAVDLHSGRALPAHEPGVIETALSHGIPMRSLMMGLAVGSTNGLIVATALLATTGTLSPFPAGLLAQAFVLPIAFGLLSQTISYRRAVRASGSSYPLPPQSVSNPPAIRKDNPMRTPTRVERGTAAFWRRSLDWLNACENAIDFDPTHNAVNDLKRQVNELRQTVKLLEQRATRPVIENGQG